MTPARTPSPAPPHALAVVVHAPGGVSMALPPVIADAGEAAARFTLEFFASRLPNANTRKAYGRAVFRFCAWCHAQGVGLRALAPPTLSAYLEGLDVSPASVKLTASALRHWLDYLTERGVLTHNPALSVRTARLVVTEGKTPVLERAQARKLFASLDATAENGHVLALRDRALFAVMLYGFVRVGAAVRMSVRDFDDSGEQAALVLHEKGGKERRIPCHHKAREFLRAYVAAAGFEPRAKGPLFQTAPGRSAKLSGEPMTIDDALRAVKRRCADAGLPASISNHSFRATGITLHQENGGRLEEAQDLAGHADARTTRLYVRKSRVTAQAEVERVQI
jgi:integrase/recombinase XerD